MLWIKSEAIFLDPIKPLPDKAQLQMDYFMHHLMLDIKKARERTSRCHLADWINEKLTPEQARQYIIDMDTRTILHRIEETERYRRSLK